MAIEPVDRRASRVALPRTALPWSFRQINSLITQVYGASTTHHFTLSAVSYVYSAHRVPPWRQGCRERARAQYRANVGGSRSIPISAILVAILVARAGIRSSPGPFTSPGAAPEEISRRSPVQSPAGMGPRRNDARWSASRHTKLLSAVCLSRCVAKEWHFDTNVVYF